MSFAASPPRLAAPAMLDPTEPDRLHRVASPDSLSLKSTETGPYDATSFIDRGSSIRSSRLSHSDRGERGHDESLAGSEAGHAPEQTEEQRRATEARRTTIAQTARIFAQLDTIRDLQSDIADRHARLEGVSALKTPDDAPSVRSEEKPAKDGAAAEADSGTRSKEQREKAQRTYQTTADEFGRREEGIDEMMAKVRPYWREQRRGDLRSPLRRPQLSELSAALKTLHSLPAPRLFSDVAPLPTDASATSSP